MEKELNSKDEEIRKLKNELNFLKAVITNKNRKIFGVSSEKGQMLINYLFNEDRKI